MTLRIYCPSCSAEIRNDSGICPTCGLTLGRLETDATRRLDSDKFSGKSSRKTISHDSIDDARFVPGTILDERYRIVGLLGKGNFLLTCPHSRPGELRLLHLAWRSESVQGKVAARRLKFSI